MWIAPTLSNSSACESRTWSGSASKNSGRTDAGSPEYDKSRSSAALGGVALKQ